MSRRRRGQVITAVVFLLLAVGLLQNLGHLPGSLSDDRHRYNDRQFVVVNVVDGDTLDLAVPDMIAGSERTRVRLWGVDTPETRHPKMGVMYYGPQASEFLERLVLNRQVRVWLEPLEDTRDKYNRLLAYIYLSDGRMLNELIISEGYGYADERFGHVFYDRFAGLQKQSQRQKSGLWRDVQPDQWPQWYRRRHDPTYSAAPEPAKPKN